MLRPLGGNEMRLHLVKAQWKVRTFLIPDHALVGVKLAPPLSTSAAAATAATGAGVGFTAPLVKIAVGVGVVVLAAASVSILAGLEGASAGESAEVGGEEAAGAVRFLACRKF